MGMDKRNTAVHTPSRIIALLACLLFIFSACSLTPGNSKGAYLSPIPTKTFTPSHSISLSPMPTTTPLTDSALASRIVQGMSLDQKLGQMVIVEFYGATVNGDLTQMIQHNQVSGVLIENKNGNAQSRDQLVRRGRAKSWPSCLGSWVTRVSPRQPTSTTI